MKKAFYEFLKKNGCLEAFKNNVSARGDFSGDVVDKYLSMSMVNPKSYVLSAFVWANTEQGYDHWRKIDDKWLRAIEPTRKVYPKTTIGDFTFRTAGYGHYKVTYTSPTTGKSWSRTIDDMHLIDATKNADEPKRKDLNILKRKCKGLWK